MKIYNKLIRWAKAVRKASYKSGSSISFPPQPLLSENINPNEADYNTLRALCIASCYTSVYKRKNSSIVQNTLILWDTIGRLILQNPSIYINETHDAPLLAEDTTVRSLFISTINFSTDSWEVIQGDPISDWGYFTKKVGNPVGNINPAYFLVFPLLEVVTQRALPEYFDEQGRVKKSFDQFEIGDYCSDISKVLNLLKKQTVKSDLSADLEKIYSHINFLFNRSAMDVIYKEWRNPAVHGGVTDPSSYIILLNITLLIAMDSCKDRLIEKIGF